MYHLISPVVFEPLDHNVNGVRLPYWVIVEWNFECLGLPPIVQKRPVDGETYIRRRDRPYISLQLRN